MRFKKGFILATVVLLVVALAACSSNPGNAPSNTGDGGKQQEPIKLTLWGGVPAEAGPQDVVDNWNAENPDIQVEYIRYVHDDAGNLKLDTALMTGQGADMFISYNLTRLKQRVESGSALDLSKYIDFDMEAKLGPYVKQWEIDGTHYAIPTKKENQFVWLNKDILDELGLPVPYDWTWEELQDYAKQMQQKTTWGFVQTLNELDYPHDGSIVTEGYVNADGTSNLDHPQGKRYLEILYNMMHVDKSTPLYGEQMANKMPADQVFLSGEAGMFLAGDWIFRSANNMKDYPRDFTVAFAPVPKITDEQTDFKRVSGVGDAISINARSPHQDAAWKFVQWYTDGGLLPQLRGGRVPSSVDAITDIDEVVNILMSDNKDTYDAASLKKVLFESNFPSFSPNLDQRAVDIRKEEYQKYFTNQQSLDETMQRLVERHESIIKQTQ